MTEICYPDSTDWGCVASAEEIAELDPIVKARAERLAWASLQRLTGFRLELCPTVVRPCAIRCSPWGIGIERVGAYDTFSPYIRNGVWYNACGCQTMSCGCTEIQELILPAQEVSGPVVVTINGAVLDPSAYRVDDGNRLVRQDGERWPLCQDMNLPLGDPTGPTFSVSFYAGLGPDENLDMAAGILAKEWYRACQGQDCRLPSTATEVTRQGVSFRIPSFDTGTSGIREVDNIVASYNPHHLKTRSRVVSVDSIRGRRRTA